MNKYLRRKGFTQQIAKDEAGLQTSEIVKGKHRFLIVVERGNDELETMIHELYHLNQSILEYYGVDYRKGSNNEAYAYMMGILSKKILPILNTKSNESTEEKHTRES